MLFNKLNKVVFFSLVTGIICSLAISGCEKNFLETSPQDSISEKFFWSSKKEAKQALTGCYAIESDIQQWQGFNGWNVTTAYLDDWADIATNKSSGAKTAFPSDQIQPTNGEVNQIWNVNYEAIATHNNFLENIDKVDMDKKEKAEMIAEVKFLRAYAYFWLSQLYGNVPLVKKVLTFDEANSVKQSSQEGVVNFTINQLTEAAEDLPVDRPSSEQGRVEKGAALALKGRLLMAEKRWDDAVKTYKKIINLNRYSIDPHFKELFEEKGDGSDEIIFAKQYKQGSDFGEATSQWGFKPGTLGGVSGFWFTQNYIDMFLMKDGTKPNTNSNLFDPDHPFDNRDPRLYATVLLPSYSKFRGQLYYGHPDSMRASGQGGPYVTGYSFNKFLDPDYDGNPKQYGGNYPLIRYAEVLLSYLEARLEAGNDVTQNLLDKSINKIRGRDAVQMPPVTETNPDKLRQIIHNERAIELAGEGGIRYWDLVRWGIAPEAIDRKFYGMKITENPDEYDGTYIINDEGHILAVKKNFYTHNLLWPIPQSELDINSNLKQNPGY